LTEPSPIIIERTPILNGINRIGKFLGFFGLNPFALDADKLLRKARKQANYDGPVPENLEQNLRHMVDAIHLESRPNAFGSLAVKRLFERTLHGRFMVEQVLAADPVIERSGIRQPVFIIGMPRTGTTILHALLHEDPAHRSPLCWECLLPHPVPQPDTFRDNEQLHTVRKEFGQLFQLVPDFKRKHHMEADTPQECIGINALDFNTFQTSAQFYMPSYMQYFEQQADKLQTMRWHKRFLQYLQSGGVRAERWLLKSPVHLIRLREIFAVYPDARIIMTHRHPAKVVASAASLICSVRSLYSDYEDPVRTGYEQADTWSKYFEKFLDSREKLGKEDQIIDLKFEDFVADQFDSVRRIYERFGWELTAETEQRMRDFLADNPKDKHGAHIYSLDDFGLTREAINERFHRYIDYLETL
jgi:hypothetical protein